MCPATNRISEYVLIVPNFFVDEWTRVEHFISQKWTINTNFWLQKCSFVVKDFPTMDISRKFHLGSVVTTRSTFDTCSVDVASYHAEKSRDKNQPFFFLTFETASKSKLRMILSISWGRQRFAICVLLHYNRDIYSETLVSQSQQTSSKTNM
jgi:hypothetical protein